jgi:hypothetical protein
MKSLPPTGHDGLGGGGGGLHMVPFESLKKRHPWGGTAAATNVLNHSARHELENTVRPFASHNFSRATFQKLTPVGWLAVCGGHEQQIH